MAEGERIAKRLARAGVSSRRGAEGLIAEGRIAVNGKLVDSPALNVSDGDKITLDGAEIAAAEPPRLWRYHKPVGLVTSAKDEKGRDTVFDALPEDMPRVMSVGRLDMNSEGLLLLTNDGGIKRKLELPSTGWLRKYRVRVNGTPDEALLDKLRKGLVIDGERFQGMEVRLDRQQGANAWLTVGLREGRNREIRRAMTEVGLVVNRLIRVSYGPFRLDDLKAGAVEEIRSRVMREQLGMEPPKGHAEKGDPRPKRRRADADEVETRDSGKAGVRRVMARPGAKPVGKPGRKPGSQPGGKAGGKAMGGPGQPGFPRAGGALPRGKNPKK